MNTVLVNSIVVAALSGLLSGIAVAVLTYFLSKRRTDAEIQNFGAQSTKALAETQKALAETQKISLELKSLSETVNYSLANSGDEVLIDGRNGLDGFDVKGFEGQFWEGFGEHAKPISEMGKGQLQIEKGVLNIHRTNTAGRFELRFERYNYHGSPYQVIPRDDYISGTRRLLVSCEAKAVGAEHSLRFVIRDPSTGTRLAQSQVRVVSNEWTTYHAFLTPEASVDSFLRIDDEDVSRAPSSVQIRSLFLSQKN